MSLWFLIKEKWILLVMLIYITLWTYQVNIFLSKPIKNDPDENMAHFQKEIKKHKQIDDDMAHLQAAYLKHEDHIILKEVFKDTHEEQNDNTVTTEESSDRNIAHKEMTNNKYEQEKEDLNETTGSNQYANRKRETILTSTEHNIHRSEPSENGEIDTGFNIGGDQPSICEPEIVQSGSDYKMAKQIWKYKIVQWMPYQRKVIDRELLNTTIGEYWQVDNCLVIDHLDVGNADAVVIPVMSLNPSAKYAPSRQFPPDEMRKPSQIWILLHNDHPYFIPQSREWDAKCLDNYFNWTMTYRSTSDIHVPYGYSYLKETPTNTHMDYTIGKTKLVSAMISGYHSNNFRLEYIKELRKYIQVDMYGRYGIPCFGHYIESCTLLKQYKFYLAFENSNCEEYVTEKLWFNGYHNNILPVVMGAPKEFYTAIAPPHSFIYAEDFKTPQYLSHYLRYLDSNKTAYNEYFKWKDTHDYCFSLLHLGMKPWKAICEKLNSLSGEHKVYKNVSSYLNPASQCRDAHWVPQEKLPVDFLF